MAKAIGEPTRTSKTTIVLDLLRREDSAMLAKLVAANGWLSHSTRAALTGLRKEDYAIERMRRDGVSSDRIRAEA